jgi:hypothetical protein
MENTILEFVQLICNAIQRENNVPFELPSQWDLSHQIWSHSHMEGIGHTKSDGAKNCGNKRKFHLQYAKVGQIREDLQGYANWRRSS